MASIGRQVIGVFIWAILVTPFGTLQGTICGLLSYKFGLALHNWRLNDYIFDAKIKLYWCCALKAAKMGAFVGTVVGYLMGMVSGAAAERIAVEPWRYWLWNLSTIASGLGAFSGSCYFLDYFGTDEAGPVWYLCVVWIMGPMALAGAILGPMYGATLMLMLNKGYMVTDKILAVEEEDKEKAIEHMEEKKVRRAAEAEAKAERKAAKLAKKMEKKGKH